MRLKFIDEFMVPILLINTFKIPFPCYLIFFKDLKCFFYRHNRIALPPALPEDQIPVLWSDTYLVPWDVSAARYSLVLIVLNIN